MWPHFKVLKNLRIGSRWKLYLDMGLSVPLLGAQLRKLDLLPCAKHDVHTDAYQDVVTAQDVLLVARHCRGLEELGLTVAWDNDVETMVRLSTKVVRRHPYSC